MASTISCIISSRILPTIFSLSTSTESTSSAAAASISLISTWYSYAFLHSPFLSTFSTASVSNTSSYFASSLTSSSSFISQVSSSAMASCSAIRASSISLFPDAPSSLSDTSPSHSPLSLPGRPFASPNSIRKSRFSKNDWLFVLITGNIESLSICVFGTPDDTSSISSTTHDSCTMASSWDGTELTKFLLMALIDGSTTTPISLRFAM
uniref:Uncharacterized protein n=1 Tax=Lutzomyia longipalpis TaxID=7200 RepID=A0A7G3B286_LUTLO